MLTGHVQMPPFSGCALSSCAQHDAHAAGAVVAAARICKGSQRNAIPCYAIHAVSGTSAAVAVSSVIHNAALLGEAPSYG